MKKVAIYGIGSFGYAILKHLGEKKSIDFKLYAYDRNQKLITHLKKNREHLYFNLGQKISKDIVFVRSPQELLKDCNILIMAVSSDSIEDIIENLKKHLPAALIIVNIAKALNWKSGERISKLIHRKLKNNNYKYAILSGGTVAKDLFNHEPLGATIACKDKLVLKDLVSLFTSNNLFIYPSNDVLGTEYASAFKNVISTLAGVIKGLNFSYGAETHIISRTAAEVEDLVMKLGGKRSTFSLGSQCWGNDLWMSCTSKTRNREFGVLIGQGISLEAALLQMKNRNKTVEGINTIRILNKIKGFNNYYILDLVYKLFSEKIGLETFKDLIFKNNY